MISASLQTSQSAAVQSVPSAPAGESDPSSEGALRPANENQTDKLSREDAQKLRELQARDREVRAHEQAHLSAAGGHAKGGASYTYERGPDKRLYAVGGEVQVDTSKVSNDPVATLRKAQVIRRAALAPTNPSAQDRRVAADAAQMEAEARVEIAEQQRSERSEGGSENRIAPDDAAADATRPEKNTEGCPACGGAHAAGAHDGMVAYAASTSAQSQSHFEARA